MATHTATVRWERGDKPFELATYNRDHTWDFGSGETLNASAAPTYKGNPDFVDPEQAFVASLSSCHMLTFLALAANKGVVVNSYIDHAEGELGKNEDGRMAMTKVVLRPRIKYEGEGPDADTLEKLHERAHKACFIANSVTTEVVVE